jgi:FkbM family methyltransferase
MIFDFLKSLNLDVGSVVFEIGCHHGYDTDTMLSTCPHSKIYAFEPDPRNLKVLKERGLYEREGLEIIEACVSNKDGWETFYLSGGTPEDLGDARYFRTGEWTASNSVKKPTEHMSVHPWCKFEKEIKVKSIKLQTFCKDFQVENIFPNDVLLKNRRV